MRASWRNPLQPELYLLMVLQILRADAHFVEFAFSNLTYIGIRHRGHPQLLEASAIQHGG